MRKNTLILTLLTLFVCNAAYAYVDGEVFSATTPEGIEMTFKVLSAADKTVQVGDGENVAIDPNYEGDLIIPTQINELEVMKIGDGAFYECKHLYFVDIPENVALGNDAFARADIKKIIVKTALSSGTFWCANIGELIINSSVNYGGYQAFFSNNIGRLEIKASDTSLIYCSSFGKNSQAMFEDCKIGTAIIERGLYSGWQGSGVRNPFMYSEIDSLYVRHNVNCRSSSNIANEIKDIFFEGMEEISSYFDKSGDNYAHISRLHLSEGLSTIGNNAFTSSLKNAIIFPASLTSIGDNAISISYAPSVTSLAQTPPTIAETTFGSNNRYDIPLYVPQGCQEKYASATGWCKFTNIIELGDQGNIITFADETTKRWCNTYFDINGDGELGEAEAAAVTDLKKVFQDNQQISSFDELQYFTRLKSIGSSEFCQCWGLTSISIPKIVTSIGEWAFYECINLNSILIPEKVTSIGGVAFSYCSSLTDVYCYATSVPTTGNDVFTNTPTSSATLHVPAGSLQTYQNTEPWSGFGTIAPIYDEESSKTFPAGTYAKADLKRTFAEGWNTICLPFAVDDIETAFGTGAKAYGFNDFAGGELKFSKVTTLTAGTPYVIYVPAEITELIAFENIVVEESNTTSSSIDKNGVCFRGTYIPIEPGEWTKNNSTNDIYGLTAYGAIRKAGADANILGFRGYFEVPAGTDVKGFVFEDGATGIDNVNANLNLNKDIYNIAGQRLNKAQKGINIINGKKILK